MTSRKTLEEQAEEAIQEARTIIERERPFVDRKPYSHNIISMALMSVAGKVGNEAANDLIDECDLAILGWEKVNES